MKVQAFIEQIQRYQSENGYASQEDPLRVLSYVNDSIRDLAETDYYDFLQRHLVIDQTVTGKRDYSLPQDFPENFIPFGSRNGMKHVCKVSNSGTTSETFLTYETPAQFYSRDITSESNAKPSHYTIITMEGGLRRLMLAPPPDSSNNYVISGLYQPTDWDLQEGDELPVVPSTNYMRWDVLRRLRPGDPTLETKFADANRMFKYKQARSRLSRVVPVFDREGNVNKYERIS